MKRKFDSVWEPWKERFSTIKDRCSNPRHLSFKNYGGRGIKCRITPNQIKKLWFRDNAAEMKKPSIDRINNDGDYVFENCRFIELSENVRKAHLGITHRNA